MEFIKFVPVTCDYIDVYINSMVCLLMKWWLASSMNGRTKRIPWQEPHTSLESTIIGLLKHCRLYDVVVGKKPEKQNMS